MSVEAEIEVLKTVVSKLDTSIEKITQVSTDVGKILAVHEQRLVGLEKIADDRDDDIKELHSRITTGNRELIDRIDMMLKTSKEQHEAMEENLRKEMQKLDVRLTHIEKWKWWMMGVAAGAGFIIGIAQKFL